MWKSAEHLFGYQAQAVDGTAGKVKDFTFDDQSWTLRYLVLDTGGWLPGRRVLISPQSFEAPSDAQRLFPLKLTKAQIENSPSESFDRPVSRRHEAELAVYYGWLPYWTVPPVPGGGAIPPSTDEPPSSAADPGLPPEGREGNSRLRSMSEVIGYRLEAKDGDIGKVNDFILNESDWTIRFLVADTRAWLPGKQVLIAPQWIQSIRWDDRHVRVDLSKDQIEHSPAYDPAEPINIELEEQLYDYYGRPHPRASAASAR